ncbi:MAG: hypothetical protein GX357_04815 [Firmicutes bacterium]|nr:hypothetical protein [Bacillota bacterium]
MSWVDLAGLLFILWGAAKGYLKGAGQVVLQLLLLVWAVPLAYALSRPVALFINDQWFIESILVGWLAQGQSIETAAQSFSAINLPPLAGKFLLQLLPPEYVLPVTNSSAALQVTAAILLRFLVLVAVFLLLAVMMRYCLHLYVLKKDGQKKVNDLHYLGLLCGALYGFVLSVFLCLALDGFSLFTATGFWQNDLTHSFLFRASQYLLQYF